MKKKQMAISYNRFSSKQQTNNFSISRQIELAEDYIVKFNAENKDIELQLEEKFVFSDPAMSGFYGENAKHGALGKLLDIIKYGQIPKGTILIVESIDRISRQKPDIGRRLIGEILDADIKIVTLFDNMVYTSEIIEDETYSRLYSLLKSAYHESEQKSIRISSSWKMKREIFAGERKPLHNKRKTLTAQIPAWIRYIPINEDPEADDKGDRFEEITDKANTIRNIFEMAFDGKGSTLIAKYLNENKTPKLTTRKRRKPKNKETPNVSTPDWHISYIQKILTNKSTYGYFQPQTYDTEKKKKVSYGEGRNDYFPSTIDIKLFNDVQEIRKARWSIDEHGKKHTGAGRHGINYPNIFRHLVICGYCNGSMHYVDKKSRGGSYLHCHNSTLGLCKSNFFWGYDNFEISFLTFLIGFDINAEFNDATESKESLKLQIKMNEEYEERNKYKEQSDALRNLYLENPDSRKDFLKEHDEIKGKIYKHESKINDLNEKINKIKIIKQEYHKDRANLIKMLTVDEFSNKSLKDRRIYCNTVLHKYIYSIELFPVGNVEEGHISNKGQTPLNKLRSLLKLSHQLKSMLLIKTEESEETAKLTAEIQDIDQITFRKLKLILKSIQNEDKSERMRAVYKLTQLAKIIPSELVDNKHISTCLTKLLQLLLIDAYEKLKIQLQLMTANKKQETKQNKIRKKRQIIKLTALRNEIRSVLIPDETRKLNNPVAYNNLVQHLELIQNNPIVKNNLIQYLQLIQKTNTTDRTEIINNILQIFNLILTETNITINNYRNIDNRRENQYFIINFINGMRLMFKPYLKQPNRFHFFGTVKATKTIKKYLTKYLTNGSIIEPDLGAESDDLESKHRARH